jgi:hypothetical protein
LKLNGTLQVLDYADDINILGVSVNNVEDNTEALLVAGKEIGLEVNANKTRYVAISRDHNAGRSHGKK